MNEMAEFVWAAPIVKVSCDKGRPGVDPEHLSVNTNGNQPTLIIWQGDPSVTEITDIVIHDPDGDYEFDQPARLGPKTWKVIDKCAHNKPYKYDITVICKNSEEEVTLDPYIDNEDTGGH